MRKKYVFIITLTFIICQLATYGQINVGQKIKQKTNERIEENIEEVIDEGLNKTEESIENSFRNDEEFDEDNSDEETKPSTDNTPFKKSKSTDNPSFQSYSKFDFIPGETIIFYEDFTQEQVGDFPLRWNTNASAEIITTNNFEGKYMKTLGDYSYYIPDIFQTLPENFTFEFDAIYFEGAEFGIEFYEREDQSMTDEYYPGNGGFSIMFENGIIKWGNYNNVNESTMQNGDGNYKDFDDQSGSKIHYSIWAQKQRLRVYANEEKVLDVPRAILTKFKYNQMRIGCYSPVMLGNIRLAIGTPDTRSKLITEGKLITHGILFDSGSDKIKPQSYGVLKSIATVLTENPEVRVKIVGHTDSDGNDQSNLVLSEKRAIAVQNALVNDFNIDKSRFEIEGKGEKEPIDPNITIDGKANNRRVEFIKL